MNFTDLLGYVAGGLTTAAFVPQVVKTWKTKSAGDISLGMFLIFFCGVSCWLLYGIALRSTPIVLANLATLLLAGTILFMKIRYK